jgi:TonB family protein
MTNLPSTSAALAVVRGGAGESLRRSVECSACGSEIESGATSCFACGQARRSLKRGQTIADRYELVRVLGHGGMGVVYETYDRSLDEKVALKVLSETVRDSAEAGRRFRAEIKLARKVRHPNVCAIHEFGEQPEIQYIVMELVEGVNLAQHLAASERLSAAEAVAIVAQVGAGLQSIHDAGVIHRDLKPSNIMMDGAGHVRVLDFGLAKQIGAPMATAYGQVLGTPAYMSPEQVQGRSTDPRADLYALGILTHELLTGRVPFEGETAQETAWLHVNGTLRLDDPVLPPSVVPILTRALARLPGDRYETVRDYVTALSGCDLSVLPRAAVEPPDAPPDSHATQRVSRRFDRPIPDFPNLDPPSPGPLPARKRAPSAARPLVLGLVSGGSARDPNRMKRWRVRAGLGAAFALLISFSGRPAKSGGSRPPAESREVNRSGPAVSTPTLPIADSTPLADSVHLPFSTPTPVVEARMEAPSRAQVQQTVRERETYAPVRATARVTPAPTPESDLPKASHSPQSPAVPTPAVPSPAPTATPSPRSAIADTPPGLSETANRPADAAQWAIKEPRKIKHVMPEYPEIARQAKIEGRIVVQCTIDARGTVTRAVVTQGVNELNRAATDAIRQWVYEPTLVNGKPVSVDITVTIEFRLADQP